MDTKLNNIDIKLRLAMQLIGEDHASLRELGVDAQIVDFESGAVMVRELIKNLVLEHAIEHGRAVARMRATVNQDGFEYQVNGLFDPKVGGLRMDVAFRRKADFKSRNKKTLVDVWNEKVGSKATFELIQPGSDDTRTLH